MYHFFVPDAGDGPVIAVTGPDVNHIRNVLRMKPGEKIVISNGADRDFYCRIREIREREVLAEVLTEPVEETELPAELILYQGLPKADKMEWIIQKAVELGAVRIVPVSMKRSVVKLDPKKKKSRQARWQKIAESAAGQCGRRRIPEVGEVLTFREALEEAGEMERILFPYENAKGMQSAKKALASLAPGQRIAVFIGPEGGFDPEEAAAAGEAGAETISLGRRILRTETAGLAMLTLCMMRLEIAAEKAALQEADTAGGCEA